MKKPRHSLSARRRFPAEVISLAVWLYFRFPLSLRMVEEMLAARGIRSAMKRFVAGPRSSVGSLPTASADALFDWVIDGISMRPQVEVLALKR